MKIGVEKYIRANGFIGKVVEESKLLVRIKDLDGNTALREKRLYNKVANTPQELIQVGDLVEVNKKHLERIHARFSDDLFGDWLTENLKCITNKHITKIFTPNEDKSQYTLQWSIEV